MKKSSRTEICTFFEKDPDTEHFEKPHTNFFLCFVYCTVMINYDTFNAFVNVVTMLIITPLTVKAFTNLDKALNVGTSDGCLCTNITWKCFCFAYHKVLN